MIDDKAAQREVLTHVIDEWNLAIDERVVDCLLGYLDLLQRWNAAYNLTAVRDPAQMLTQHLLDCLAVIPPLRHHLEDAGTAAGAGIKRVLDVGSGAGLPGVVIAAACPAWEVVCVDAVGKKVAFIRQVAVEMKLSNLRGEHARVEQLSAGTFDVVTSRAFASLNDMVSLTRRHLTEEGVWMAMKGKRPAAELDALPSDVEVFHVEQLLIPGLSADRCLVWMRPLR